MGRWQDIAKEEGIDIWAPDEPQGGTGTAVTEAPDWTNPAATATFDKSPMTIGEKLRRGRESMGRTAEAGANPVLDFVNPYKNPMTAGFFPGSLNRAKELVDSSGLATIGKMPDAEAAGKVERYFSDIKPPADYVARKTYRLEDFTPAQKDLWTRANWMAETAEDWNAEVQARAGLGTRIGAGAVENVGYQAEFAAGEGLVRGVEKLAGTGFKLGSKWGGLLAAIPFVAMDLPAVVSNLRAPQVAKDEYGNLRRVGEGAGWMETAVKAPIKVAADYIGERIGGKIFDRVTGPAWRIPKWAIDKATGGKASRALDWLSDVGYAVPMKIANVVPPSLKPLAGQLRSAYKTTADITQFRGLGEETKEEVIQAWADALGNLNRATDTWGLHNLPAATWQFIQQLPEIVGTLGLMMGGQSTLGIPHVVKVRKTVNAELGDMFAGGDAHVPEDYKKLPFDDRIQLLNARRDVRELTALGPSPGFAATADAQHGDTLKELGPEDPQALWAEHVESMDPAERHAELTKQKGLFYLGRLVELGLEDKQMQAVMKLPDNEIQDKIRDLQVDRVLEQQGFEKPFIDKMNPAQKRAFVEKTWRQGLDGAVAETRTANPGLVLPDGATDADKLNLLAQHVADTGQRMAMLDPFNEANRAVAPGGQPGVGGGPAAGAWTRPVLGRQEQARQGILAEVGGVARKGKEKVGPAGQVGPVGTEPGAGRMAAPIGETNATAISENQGQPVERAGQEVGPQAGEGLAGVQPGAVGGERDLHHPEAQGPVVAATEQQAGQEGKGAVGATRTTEGTEHTEEAKGAWTGKVVTPAYTYTPVKGPSGIQPPDKTADMVPETVMGRINDAVTASPELQTKYPGAEARVENGEVVLGVSGLGKSPAEVETAIEGLRQALSGPSTGSGRTEPGLMGPGWRLHAAATVAPPKAKTIAELMAQVKRMGLRGVMGDAWDRTFAGIYKAHESEIVTWLRRNAKQIPASYPKQAKAAEEWVKTQRDVIGEDHPIARSVRNPAMERVRKLADAAGLDRTQVPKDEVAGFVRDHFGWKAAEPKTAKTTEKKTVKQGAVVLAAGQQKAVEQLPQGTIPVAPAAGVPELTQEGPGVEAQAQPKAEAPGHKEPTTTEGTEHTEPKDPYASVDVIRRTTLTIQRVMGDWFGEKAKDRYEVLANQDAVPAKFRDRAPRLLGMPEPPIQAYHVGGKVFFVAEEMAKGAERAGMSLEAYVLGMTFHEYGVHYGLRRMMEQAFPDDEDAQGALEDLLASVVDSVGRDKMFRARGGLVPDNYEAMDDLQLAEEYLARIAQKMDAGTLTEQESGVWADFVAWLKGVLQLTGIKVKLSDADIEGIARMAVRSVMDRREEGQLAAAGTEATETKGAAHETKDVQKRGTEPVVGSGEANQPGAEGTAGEAGVKGQVEAPGREPWQMTRQEFVNAGPDGYSPNGNYGWSKTGGDHGVAVLDAISEGKPVPPEVLADYPDLPEVLADYPDLAAKYGKAEAPKNKVIAAESNEEMPLKKQKEYLFDKIDDAIVEAPEEAVGKDERELFLDADGRAVLATDTEAQDAGWKRLWSVKHAAERAGIAEEDVPKTPVQELKWRASQLEDRVKELQKQQTKAFTPPDLNRLTVDYWNARDAAVLAELGDTITIEVPGDGKFTVPNNKEALREFKEKYAKDFPTGAGALPKTRVGSVAEREAPKLGKPDGENSVKAVSSVVSKETARRNLTRSFSDGAHLVATDGRQMIAIKGDFGGTPAGPMFRDSKGAVVKPDEDERSFPDYGVVIPKKNLTLLAGGADTAELYKTLSQSKAMTDERFESVNVYSNTDGTLGFKTVTPEVGEYELNVKDGAKVVTAVNPAFFMNAMTVARRLGNEKVDIYVNADHPGISSMVVRGANHVYMIMPIQNVNAVETFENPKAGKAVHPVQDFEKPGAPKTEPIRILGGKREKKAPKGAKTLLHAQNISDFEPGRDVVVRRGDRTFVVDKRGRRADTEVISDKQLPEHEANLRKLNPAQLDRMESEIQKTPYLSPEGKTERLATIKEIRSETAPPVGAGGPQFSVGDEGQARREFDAVAATRDEHRGEDGKLLAPNGQPSLLNEGQWTRVRTPSFKTWFGDWEKDPAGASKVVDENGEPSVLYHGTKDDIHVFSRSREGDFGHFGGREQANMRVAGDRNAAIVPVYLTMHNPRRSRDTGGSWATRIASARAAGYDGIVYLNRYEGVGPETTLRAHERRIDLDKLTDGEFRKFVPEASDSYIAFEDGEIKSATGNAGTYMGTDIRFSVGIETAKDWATGQVVDVLSKTELGKAVVAVARAEGDTNARPDINWFEKTFGKPQRYMRKTWAGARVWALAMDRRTRRFIIENKLFGIDLDTGRNELKVITDYVKKMKQEFVDRWSSHVFRRDKDQVGYAVKKQEGVWNLYTPDNKLLVSFDDEEEAWAEAHVRERADMLAGRDYVLAADGVVKARTVPKYSTEGADAILAYRRINDRGYHELLEKLESIEQEQKDAGEEAERVEFNGEEMSIFDAYREMGQLRGSYMARLRTGGRYILSATKEGENPWMDKFDDPGRRFIKRVQLQKEGWKTEERLSDAPSESAFADTSMVATNELVQNALAEMKKHEKLPKDLNKVLPDGSQVRRFDYVLKTGGIEPHLVIEGPKGGRFPKVWEDLFKAYGTDGYYDAKNDRNPNGLKGWHFAGDLAQIEKDLIAAAYNTGVQVKLSSEFGRAFVRQLATLFEARGSRARKIGRSGEVGEKVVLGYEKDPVKAMVASITAIAGGSAKSETVQAMLHAMMGIEVPWREYRANYLVEYEKDHKGEYDAMTPQEKRAFARELWETFDAEVQERRLHSGIQKNAYDDTQSFIEEQMRNEEPIDRVFGFIKGLAALKFLTGIKSGIVNLTSLATTVPAVFHQEAKIPFATTLKLVVDMGAKYGRYRIEGWRGKPSTLSAEDQWLFHQISKRHWDEAPFNLEAMGVLNTEASMRWRKVMDLAMIAFSETERMNRASTVAAGYKGLVAQHKGALKPEDRETYLNRAKEMTDSAHGVYGKEGLLGMMRGGGIGAHAAQAALMYRIYPHNLLHMMVEMGISKDKADRKALAYLWISMPIIAGPSAFIGVDGISMFAKAIMGLLGQEPPDDPQESFFEWVDETFGWWAGYAARGGIAGALGTDVSGSMSMGMPDLPVSLNAFMAGPAKAEQQFYQWIGETLAGPAGSMLVEMGSGVTDIGKGHFGRAAERLAPKIVAAPIQAFREGFGGIETRAGQPVFYGKEQLHPSVMSALMRALSFNPMEVSGKRAEQWSETRIKQHYQAERGRINDMIDEVARDPRGDKWEDVLAEAEEYNRKIRAQGYTHIPQITEQALKTRLKHELIAPKSERERFSGKALEKPNLLSYGDALDVIRGAGE